MLSVLTYGDIMFVFQTARQSWIGHCWEYQDIQSSCLPFRVEFVHCILPMQQRLHPEDPPSACCLALNSTNHWLICPYLVSTHNPTEGSPNKLLAQNLWFTEGVLSNKRLLLYQPEVFADASLSLSSGLDQDAQSHYNGPTWSLLLLQPHFC